MNTPNTAGLKTCLVGCSLFAAAAVSPAAAKEGSGRELGGHRFAEVEQVPSPFITTKAASKTGAGFATAQFKGPESSLELDLGVLGQSFELAVAATDYLSINGELGASILSGADLNGALLVGLKGGYETSLGAKGRILRIGALQVAGSLTIDFDRSIQFDIRSAIDRSLSEGKVSAATLLQKSKSTTAAPGIHVAYGFGPSLGLWASASYERAIESDEESDGGTLRTGAGLSADLNATTNVPIGLVALGTWEQGEETSTKEAGFGLLYTGRPELQTGAEVQVNSTEGSFGSGVKLTLNGVVGLFKLRYYW